MFVGIDSTEIKRIEEAIKKDGFLLRVFSKAEREELSARSNNAAHLAAAFAAKEAFSKALGTGLSGFSLNEVSLLHLKSGKPYLFLTGAAKKIAEEKGLCFDVSITHTSSVATAIVIAFSAEGRECFE